MARRGPNAAGPRRVDALGPARHAGKPVPARERPARIIAGGDFGGPDQLVLGWGPAWMSDRWRMILSGPAGSGDTNEESPL
ncbi:hypothetical protein [Streptomyces anulatus]|uniref:hypothetical protein n=1 Tax=Streptomyces anulatus TaxID=1892 RepID=UPI002ED5086C|nr:hypothetical protein OG703_26265 [Streptomyces anulatus]